MRTLFNVLLSLTLALTPALALAGTGSATGNIKINELFPNPVGDDTTGEFIELINLGTTDVDISGWTLDDLKGGGSTPYVFPAGTTLAAEAITAFMRPDTKLSLNNDTDEANLWSPDGILVDTTTYTEVFAEGISLARKTDGTMAKTGTPTPSAANIFDSGGNLPETGPADSALVALAIGVSIAFSTRRRTR